MYYFFQDEYEVFNSSYQELEASLAKEFARKGEACDQTANSWHDNFDYEDAERNIRMLAPRVQQMKKILLGAKIVLEEVLGEKVMLGCRVRYSVGEKICECLIGGYNTRILGRIAYNSPIGEALVGKQEGELFSFMVEGKRKEGKILSVNGV